MTAVPHREEPARRAVLRTVGGAAAGTALAVALPDGAAQARTTYRPAHYRGGPLLSEGGRHLVSRFSYGINRRNRDFDSTHQVLASNYQVIVDTELLEQAKEALARPKQD